MSRRSKRNHGLEVDIRVKTDVNLHTRLGKLGERAFQRVCERFGLPVQDDHSYWHKRSPRHHRAQDIPYVWTPEGERVQNHLLVDVKTVYQSDVRRWLLVEDHKAKADVYVLVALEGPEEDEGKEVVYLGYATHKMFYADDQKAWFHVDKGEQFPKPEHVLWMHQRASGMQRPLVSRELMDDAYSRMEVWLGDSLYMDWLGGAKAGQMGLPICMLRQSVPQLRTLLGHMLCTGRPERPETEKLLSL
jgi:hypothetical protein